MKIITSFIITLCILAGLGTVFFEIVGDFFREEAIRHHAAHYVCDPQTGKTTFQWNDEACK